VTGEIPDNELLRRIVPPLAGVVLAVAFAALGFWQIERAGEKKSIAAQFDANAPYTQLANLEAPTAYRPVEARGRFLGERQVLIDNIVRGGRIGYFVITPLEIAPQEPLLLVNRGWFPKGSSSDERPDLSIDGEWQSVRGRVGFLPRVGIRSGAGFANPGDWPRVAVYPTNEELGAQLGRAVLPYVLLLDQDHPGGYARDWRPEQAGPMRHYGYAFQWFALCATVIALGLWHYRRGSMGK